MLKLNPSPTFRFRVQIGVPGSPEPASLVLIGKHKTTDELVDWSKRAHEGGSDLKFLVEAIAGWAELVDDEGKEVPFSETMLGSVLQKYPGSSAAITRAYIAELNSARTKNS